LVSAALPARHREYVLRLFVGMQNPLVTALTCGLVFVFAIRLGYPLGLSAALTFTFGTTTAAWQYSKHFLSEPVTGFFLLLAAYAAFVGVRQRVRRTGFTVVFLAGLCLGLAIGSKISTVIVVPGVVLYVLFPPHVDPAAGRPRQAAALRCLALLLGLGGPAMAVAAANYARFGDPLQTGYATSPHWFDFGRLGVPGLLYSPTKSVFLYTPIAVLSVVGFGAFWSRFPREAVLFAFVFAAHIVFYGSLTFWHGDVAWGPRYLVPTTALLTLPAGAAVAWSGSERRRAAAKWLFALAAVGGLAIQSGGIAQCPVAYPDLSAGSVIAGPRYWDAGLSPVVGHWRLLLHRFDALQRQADVVRASWSPQHAAARPSTSYVIDCLVPSLPVTDEQHWGTEAFKWFYVPDTQILDVWTWHLYYSGLPKWLLAAAGIPAMGLLTSAAGLVLPIRRDPRRGRWFLQAGAGTAAVVLACFGLANLSVSLAPARSPTGLADRTVLPPARPEVRGGDGNGAASPSLATSEGNLELVDDRAILGWAWDSARPNAAVSVDIFDGDDLLATVRADLYRQDLVNAGKGDGRHGFIYPVPETLRDGRTHRIRVRVTGTRTNLHGTPQTMGTPP
jgi:hypothetical protein